MVSSKTAILLAASLASQLAAAVNISVSASGGNATSGHQYGFLHEDINNSGDGGIYAELIINRAFQYSDAYPVSLAGWSPIGGAVLSLKNLSDPLSSVLPVSMNVAPGSNLSSAAFSNGSAVGFANEGYWGMDVKVQTYTGSFWVKGAYDGVFTASLQSNLTGEVFGSVDIQSRATADEWVEHEVELVPSADAPNSNNTFAITFDPQGLTGGSLDFNLISLFPPTYKGRKNGLRVDIADALEGMHPSWIRLPGGNMLEGLTNKTYWDWKDSLGPLRYRPGFQGVWGYQQTHGLGLMEYLYWAEDMNMDIVVAVWDGLSLDGGITPRSELQPFVDDALDEIEFIRGDASTTWGARRAELGRPEPFDLRYVEVGNEDWLEGGAAGWEAYKEYRLPLFTDAILAAYPDIQIIASGATYDGIDIPEPAIGDYHPYRTPDALVGEFGFFDNNPVGHIVGEVAATFPNGGTSWAGGLYVFPWWIGSVGEAISMIGYERNCDRIKGTFYAPILRNMNRWQWAVTNIQFAADPALTTRSTSWYIWELFAGHPMTNTLPATSSFDPVFYVAGTNADKGTFVWKGAVYNTTDGADVPVSLAFEGVEAGAAASLTVLAGPENPYGWNDPFTRVNVVNSTTYALVAGDGGVFEFGLPELSVAVLETDVVT